ncbi:MULTISPECIES: sensor histidine kinase [unclassified Plantibacter]|uniref:sensor histidine kinase n=1 Tax=unclassified Plantibacter TaxID=2624265 RepID=UPI003D32841E
MIDALDVPYRSLTTRTIGLALHLIGLGFVVWFAITTPTGPPYTLPIVLIGVVCWLTAAVLGWFDRPDLDWIRVARMGLWSAVLVVGALASGSGAGTAYALVAGGLFALFASITTPLTWTGAVTVVAALVAWGSMEFVESGAAGEISADAPQLLLWSVVGIGSGLIRRQRAIEQRAHRRRLADEATNTALVERARIARDVHDVLAHSLGGLVVQLDATEAVLESRGVDADVVARVAASRALAVEGLAEAKRAVDALRGVAQPLGQGDIAGALEDLVAAAQAIDGARVRFVQTGQTHTVDPTVARTFVGIVREALTNARKHAPGSDVDVELTWTATGERVRVTNALQSDGDDDAGHTAHGLARSGGGHGLLGMRERAEGVDARFSAARQGASWVVECEVSDV